MRKKIVLFAFAAYVVGAIYFIWYAEARPDDVADLGNGAKVTCKHSIIVGQQIQQLAAGEASVIGKNAVIHNDGTQLVVFFVAYVALGKGNVITTVTLAPGQTWDIGRNGSDAFKIWVVK